MTIQTEAKLTHQHKCLFRADDLHIRIANQNLFNGSTVIRLHMVNYQIIQRTLPQKMFHILQQLTAGGPVYGVK